MRDFKLQRKDDFKDEVLELNRVTRVVAGGKRFRFQAIVVVGDKKGKVGIGIAKGLDVQSTIERAKNYGIKNMVEIKMKDRTIAHEVEAKYSAARVLIRPAKSGHGLMAGGAARVVLKLVGIQDVTAKCLGRTNNKLTNAQATIEALKKLRTK